MNWHFYGSYSASGQGWQKGEEMMQNHVWRDPNSQSEVMAEGLGRDQIETKVTEIVADEISKSLRLSWNKQTIVSLLFHTILEPTITRLLGEYLNHELEILSETVAKSLNVKSKVDYNYATYAKFSSMLEDWKARIDGKPTSKE